MKDQSKVRNAVIRCYVTKREKKAVQDHATRAGLSESDLVRELLSDRLGAGVIKEVEKEGA